MIFACKSWILDIFFKRRLLKFINILYTHLGLLHLIYTFMKGLFFTKSMEYQLLKNKNKQKMAKEQFNDVLKLLCTILSNYVYAS